jgi:hypothetical protein
MPKNGKSIRLAGRHHSMPICFVDLMDNLQALTCAESVGTGTWARKGNSGKELRVETQYYDRTTRTFKLNARCEEYVQIFFLRHKPDFSEQESREAMSNSYT